MSLELKKEAIHKAGRNILTEKYLRILLHKELKRKP